MAVQLLRIPETAARLAVSRYTVYSLISSGQLPAVVGPNGATRVKESDLEAYVESLAKVGASVRGRAS